jgi:hypothetical protein
MALYNIRPSYPERRIIMTIKIVKINGIPTAVIIENITMVKPITTWASEVTFIGGQTLTIDTEFYTLMKHLYGVTEEELKQSAVDSEKIEIPEHMSIEDCGFSVRTFNTLKRAGINTVEELLAKPTEELKHLKGMGRSIEEVQKFISKIKE